MAYTTNFGHIITCTVPYAGLCLDLSHLTVRVRDGIIPQTTHSNTAVCRYGTACTPNSGASRKEMTQFTLVFSATSYKKEKHYNTTDKHENKTLYQQDRQQRDGHTVVDAAVSLSKTKRYTQQRDCGVRSTITMIARGGGKRYGNGEKRGFRKSERSVKYGWAFGCQYNIKMADQP